LRWDKIAKEWVRLPYIELVRKVRACYSMRVVEELEVVEHIHDDLGMFGGCSTCDIKHL